MSKTIARNKKAFHDYDILEKHVAGIELQGTEVKSIRAGRVNLRDSYAYYSQGELYAQHIHISPFEQGNRYNHEPYRKRRLLMRKREIEKLGDIIARKQLTLVPLSMYFDRQWVKVEIGLCRGRKKYDKRRVIADAESKRRLAGIMKRGR